MQILNSLFTTTPRKWQRSKQLRCVVQLKTCDVLKVSVLICTSRSDRKILDRFLRSQQNISVVTELAKRNCLLGWRSPATPIGLSFGQGEHGHVQDVDVLVSC